MAEDIKHEGEPEEFHDRHNTPAGTYHYLLERDVMVARLPFLNWTPEEHVGHDLSPVTHYYLLNERGGKIFAAVGVYTNKEANDRVYKTDKRFIANYGNLLGLKENRRWSEIEDMIAWLNRLIHNSSVFGHLRCF